MHNHDENVRPDRDSNLVPPGYQPQSIFHPLEVVSRHPAVQSQNAVSAYFTTFWLCREVPRSPTLGG